MSGDRTKFKYQNKLIYGLHPEGILEIKIHAPRKKNAVFKKTMIQLAELFDYASKSDEVKCVVLHGGKIFCTGNDVEAFQIGREDTDFIDKMVKELLSKSLNRLLDSMYNLQKPLVALVRGYAIGLGFTMLSLADFVYCTPEARFFTPFMQSFQSPEGSSSVNFPQFFGPRKASELLLLDTMINAKEALAAGFVNGIIKDIPLDQGDWPELMKIPCVPKLLASELSTLVRAKRLLTEGQGRERMAEAIQRESEALHQIWVSKEFPDKMMAYLLQLQFKSKEPTKATTQSQQDILKGGNKARSNGQPKL